MPQPLEWGTASHTLAEGCTELGVEVAVCPWSTAELEFEVLVKRPGSGEIVYVCISYSKNEIRVVT